MRVVNRLVSALLALFLVAAGVIVTVEIVLAALDDRHWLIDWRAWRHFALTNHWSVTSVRLGFYACCAGGLLLVILALFRLRPLALPAGASPDMEVRVRRSGLQASLRRAAEAVDGIGRARVRLGRRKVRVRADATRRDTTGLPDAVTAAIRQRMAAFELSPEPRVDVAVSRRSGR